jgi:hypothetical protein
MQSVYSCPPGRLPSGSYRFVPLTIPNVIVGVKSSATENGLPAANALSPRRTSSLLPSWTNGNGLPGSFGSSLMSPTSPSMS